MVEVKILSGGDQFYEGNDHDRNRPLQILLGQELQVMPTDRQGGPSGRTRGWRVAPGSRAVVARIGRADKKFTFPPEGETPVIFPVRKRG